MSFTNRLPRVLLKKNSANVYNRDRNRDRDSLLRANGLSNVSKGSLIKKIKNVSKGIKSTPAGDS